MEARKKKMEKHMFRAGEGGGLGNIHKGETSPSGFTEELDVICFLAFNFRFVPVFTTCNKVNYRLKPS
jgi:hypothetical protein